MFAYMFRMIAGAVVGHLVRGVIRTLADPARREETVHPSPQPPTRPSRIQIDRNNIVDGDFEDISNRDQR